MGSMSFGPQTLADTLSETVGYKSGLALSINEMCDHLCGTYFSDLLRASEEGAVRLRSEEYEHLFYRLLHQIGYTADEYDGDITGTGLFHRYRDNTLEEWVGVTELFAEIMPKLVEETVRTKQKSIDPRPFLQTCFNNYGHIGLEIAVNRLKAYNQGLYLHPGIKLRYIEWKSEVALTSLFSGTSDEPEVGRFIDQRFIDYLSANQECLSKVHWRKFEELTGEFFHREGYQVELGPGSNDDGVDVRVWKPGQKIKENPHILIQCKRQKAKVEKVIIKGLYADVTYQGADYGLLATTSELSPGARATIVARGYPIREVERSGLESWLIRLRTPGTGIVRA